MRKVYAIGETVFDIIFKNNSLHEGKAGGSMLNTSISLGRLNVPIAFISDFGKDILGDLINEFLISNSVDTQFVTKNLHQKTSLALAFLDENNNAQYSFYKPDLNEKILYTFPDCKAGDIILFGSFYGLKHDIREELKAFLNKSDGLGTIIMYDPNFRKSHKNELKQMLPFIEENLRLAHIIKGSDEDFSTIFDVQNPDDCYEYLKKYNVSLLIYTANKNGVDLFTNQFKKHYEVPRIEPISTIGAGDTFNAGIIYGFLKHDINILNIHETSEKQWNEIINTAIAFATNVCLSYENYLTRDFIETHNFV